MADVNERRFDLDALDPDDPFEIDDGNRPHLAKHAPYTEHDVLDAYHCGEPRYFPAPEPEHWLLVAHIPGAFVVIPLAPSRSGDPAKCRPIGIYSAPQHLVALYEETG